MVCLRVFCGVLVGFCVVGDCDCFCDVLLGFSC